jgi:phosphoglycerate dehydrogenase-like enzyme
VRKDDPVTATVRVVPTTWISPRLRAGITGADPSVELIDLDDVLQPSATGVVVQPDLDESAQRRYDEALTSADVWFGLPRVSLSARLIPASERLRWVHTVPAGGGTMVRELNLSPADLERVTFTTSAGAHGRALAEFAVFGLLAGAKDLPRLRADQREHRWGEQWMMRGLHGQTVLVLGLGGIGTEVARLLQALDCRVIGVRRHPEPTQYCDEVHGTDELPELIGRVDSMVITLPRTDATTGLVDRALLTRARPGLVIANVGRGSVIEEPALIDGLRDGTVGFACLDVTATEPLPAESPLWDMDNVLISPHTAALEPDLEDRVIGIFTDNLHRYLRGEPMRNVVDTVEFY